MDKIWQGEDTQDLDRGMVLRVTNRARDYALAGFLFGVIVGVGVAALLLAVQ